MKKGKKEKNIIKWLLSTRESSFNISSLKISFLQSLRSTVQEWLGSALDPTEWGWVSQEGVLTPVFTDRPVALDGMLRLISCGCKTGCSSEKLCYCKRAGNCCTIMCTVCVGQLFKNSQPVEGS